MIIMKTSQAHLIFKLTGISFLTLFSLHLLSSEYTDWTQKLACQAKCDSLGFGKCVYLSHSQTQHKEEQCRSQAKEVVFLVLN